MESAEEDAEMKGDSRENSFMNNTVDEMTPEELEALKASVGEEKYKELDETQNSVKGWTVLAVIYTFIGASLFYHYYNGWDWLTAIFYCSQNFFAIGFGVPVDKTIGGKIFTGFMLLNGTGLVSVITGFFINSMLRYAKKAIEAGALRKHQNESISILREQRMKKNASNPSEALEAPVVQPAEEKTGTSLDYLLKSNLFADEVKMIYGLSPYTAMRVSVLVLILCWYGVGVLYGYWYKWDWIDCFFFPVSTLTTAGMLSPVCTGNSPSDCSIERWHALVMTIYILFGCTLYTICMTILMGYVVELETEAYEEKKLHKPITLAEFKFASTLLDQGKTENEGDKIDIGEFIIFEVLRQGKLDKEELNNIKNLFLEIDDNNNNFIEFEELKALHMAVLDKTVESKKKSPFAALSRIVLFLPRLMYKRFTECFFPSPKKVDQSKILEKLKSKRAGSARKMVDDNGGSVGKVVELSKIESQNKEMSGASNSMININVPESPKSADNDEWFRFLCLPINSSS